MLFVYQKGVIYVSNKDIVINLTNGLPDTELASVVELLKSLHRAFNINDCVEEVEPDEWDLQMIAEAEKENNGTTIPLEE